MILVKIGFRIHSNSSRFGPFINQSPKSLYYFKSALPEIAVQKWKNWTLNPSNSRFVTVYYQNEITNPQKILNFKHMNLVGPNTNFRPFSHYDIVKVSNRASCPCLLTNVCGKVRVNVQQQPSLAYSGADLDWVQKLTCHFHPRCYVSI